MKASTSTSVVNLRSALKRAPSPDIVAPATPTTPKKTVAFASEPSFHAHEHWIKSDADYPSWSETDNVNYKRNKTLAALGLCNEARGIVHQSNVPTQRDMDTRAEVLAGRWCIADTQNRRKTITSSGLGLSLLAAQDMDVPMLPPTPILKPMGHPYVGLEDYSGMSMDDARKRWRKTYSSASASLARAFTPQPKKVATRGRSISLSATAAAVLAAPMAAAEERSRPRSSSLGTRALSPARAAPEHLTRREWDILTASGGGELEEWERWTRHMDD